MERDRLIALLSGIDEATVACRAALHHGADFTLTADALPASHYAAIYRRRARHVQRRGIPSLNFAGGVRMLEAAGDDPVNLGSVTITTPPHHFQLFMARDLSAVLACIGVNLAC